jgi:hypothetical protein
MSTSTLSNKIDKKFDFEYIANPTFFFFSKIYFLDFFSIVASFYSAEKVPKLSNTVKLGNKERFDKELIGIKEPFPVTNLPFTS